MIHGSLLRCKFCGAEFYPDQKNSLHAHELTCQPWQTGDNSVPGASSFSHDN